MKYDIKYLETFYNRFVQLDRTILATKYKKVQLNTFLGKNKYSFCKQITVSQQVNRKTCLLKPSNSL